jgi:superfamily II DNA or RNA helicase
METAREGKGFAFEVAVKWWLQNDPSWANFFDKSSVKLWAESDLADGPDIGIDLTAQDSLGRNWAVQVKNWNVAKPLPKGEIDKFLSASNTRKFFGRLLITTTKEISRNALRAISDQEKECIVLSYDALAESTAWDSFLTKPGRQPRRLQTNLFPHQKEALESVVAGFNAGTQRAQLLMACGTGKTVTAQKISETISSKFTVFLVPSLLLVQQARTSWLEHHDSSNAPKALAVCSDDSVVDDEFSSSVLDLPFHVTTDSKEISRFLKLDGNLVIFSTYQSFPALEEGIRLSGANPDLVIFDEAHKLAGAKGRVFSSCLNSEALEGSRHLFMTATPKVFRTAKSTDGKFDEQVFSMDDTEVFGPVLFNYSFGRAIADQRLSKYEVVIMPVRDSEARRKIEDRAIFQIDGRQLDAEMLAVHVGLSKAMSLFGINRVISFHSSIQRARDFASFHPWVSRTLSSDPRAVGVEARILTGSDSARKRKQVLDDLAATKSSEFKLVTNARCLTEGVDIPALDGIAFIDPKTSQTDIVQAVGRAIRKGKNKEAGYIVLPVFISDESIELSQIDSERFRHVVSVLNALRSHDTNLVVSFGNLRYSLGRHGSLSRLPDGIELFGSEEIPEDFLDSVQAYLVRNASPSWEEMFGMIERYIDQNGQAQLPAINQTPEEKQIYSWLTSQRTLHRKGLLADDRRAKLESQAWWTWDPFEDSWDKGLQALKKHLDMGGSCTVPRGFTFEGVNLFNFIRLHRNKSERLTPERRAQLSALSQWSWDPFREAWEAKFSELKKVVGQSGDWTLSSLSKDERRPLLEWIGKQRSHKNSRLEDWQIAKFETLPGWKWKVEQWSENFSLLQSYVDSTGTSQITSNSNFKGKRLGPWVASQRMLYKSSKLSQDRIDKLENLPYWSWAPSLNSWANKYESLLRFLTSNDLNDISSKTEFEGWRIGEWVHKLRRNPRSLSVAQKSQLGEISGWTFGQRKSEIEFNRKFEILEKYVEKFGTSVTPSGYIFEGINLGNWVANRKSNMNALTEDQRRKLEGLPDWKSGQPMRERLTQEQKAALATLPFLKSATSKETWEENSMKVADFVARTSPVRISNREVHQGVKIGRWLEALKRQKEKLSEKQIAWLEQLPGWTWSGREDVWFEQLNLLREYHSQFGTTRVPQGKMFNEFPLGTWVARQRKQREVLDEGRKRVLEDLADWSWDPQEDDWNAKFQAFAKHPEINFNSREGRELRIDGLSIGSWYRTQRMNWKKLPADKQERLRSCPHWEVPN